MKKPPAKPPQPAPALPVDPWAMFMEEMMGLGEERAVEAPAGPEPCKPGAAKSEGNPKRPRRQRGAE